MLDSSDRDQAAWVSASTSERKRLGGYLVEAGLLTPSQVDVALNDQKLTGMRFGEILAARGWVKQQTIEYLMQKVVLPEQEAAIREQSYEQEKMRESTLSYKPLAQSVDSSQPLTSSVHPSSHDHEKFPARRDIPIAKPLPSVSSGDGDVSWVG
jgi:hypothetical protein